VGAGMARRQIGPLRASAGAVGPLDQKYGDNDERR